jgi:hypothetical protein
MIVNTIRLKSTSPQETINTIASFNLSEPSYTDRYIIRNISGLDVDELIPRLYGSGASGSKFYSMRQPPREVAIRIILNPNYGGNETPEKLRQEFYKAISSYRTAEVQLDFMSNSFTTVGFLKGFITKIEAGLFNQVPEIQITIRCDYPFFRSTNRVSLTGLNPSAPAIADYVSTAPHGFRFTATFSSQQAYFQMSKPGDSDWKFRINRTFYLNDVLYFSSEDDNKYLYVMTNGGVGGTQTSLELASYIVAGSIWPIIFPGFNQFLVSPANLAFNTCDHYETYWGV